ncbi:MAG: flagellar motor protein MotB [Candidatus Abyssobacteria bacterium SURF_17]|uniref:Flagellar motor protein MotB n=1 Tax=Candidatus Abyssobacteria bacterium SURF_17 TaxID=2093361 RepID=A0A419F4J4_9BACT|nr:MAG: flagellar motor protein MotB [Candidatus Abyssubacteria bacterium SURF_17]
MGKYGKNNGNNQGEVDSPVAPGWMVTYGDIMGLLLTFFVLLLSYSTIKEEAFRRAISSFQEALGVLPQDRSVMNFEHIPAVRLSPPLPPEEIMKRIRNAISGAGLRESVRVKLEREGIRITIQTPILFDSGKADLRPDALPVLDELVKIFGESPNDVVVEGHTDNVPIHTPEFPSNWELSTARAISVTRYFFQKGNLKAARFAVAGYGEYHPVAANDTPEGRQENRRVEILLKNIEQTEAPEVKEGGT